MEAEPVAAALAIQESVYYAGMMGEPGFEKTFSCLPIDIDNTSVLHVAENNTYSSPVNHQVLRLLFVRDIIQKGK